MRESAPDEPECLSIVSAARRLGVGRSTVFKMIAQGSLPTVKIGRRRMIRASPLRAWLDAAETERVPAKGGGKASSSPVAAASPGTAGRTSGRAAGRH